MHTNSQYGLAIKASGGLVGDLCKFCGGSCFVTREKYAKFDSILLDENDCPRCNGSGLTGKMEIYANIARTPVLYLP